MCWRVYNKQIEEQMAVHTVYLVESECLEHECYGWINDWGAEGGELIPSISGLCVGHDKY